MSRSSTSSSSPIRVLRRTLVVAVLVVALAKSLLRLPMIESAMGPPDLYYSGDVTVRLDALDEVLAMEGRVDVLFVGSSVVRANIRPREFDRTLAEAGFDVVSFNGRLSAAWAGTVRLYVDGLWLEEVNPGVVVQAIRFEELVNASLSQQAGGGIEGRYESLW